MQPLLYSDLVPFYRLIDPPEDHRDEAASYQAAFERALEQPQTLLELGAGAGHNASHLTARFRCTLTDLSEPMLDLSRQLNPQCEHLAGDMRTLRLGRTFDVVLVHDAVAYMTSEPDLAAAIATAFVHTRPGGAAIFAPDCLRETFCESADSSGGTSGTRAVQYLAWQWDPDPSDDTMVVDYAFLLRNGSDLKAVHDRHIEGLFPRATWQRLLTAAGYLVETFPRPLGDDQFDECFLCRRP